MRSLLFCLQQLLLLLARSASADPYDGYMVSQIHLAQGKTPATMTVQWATASAAASDVVLSLTAEMLGPETVTVTGTSSSYTFASSNYTSPVIHTVILTHLQPRTTYYYRCGDSSAVDQMSGVLQFSTLPAPGSASPLSFGVIGDLGATNYSKRTVGHLLMNPSLQMILHAGDLSYADCNQPKWDLYGLMVEPLSNNRPWMVGPGNHEIEFEPGDDGSGLYRSFETRYRMPWTQPAQLGKIVYQDWFGCCPSAFTSEYNYGNSFYSFETGLVHFVYVNSYSTTDSSSVQYKWLQADLQSVDRSVTPWVIVVMHCPWYNSNLKHNDEPPTVQMKANMEQLLYEHNVNVVISGHVHAYERSWPVYKNVTDPKGIVYLNIGDGGNAEGHDTHYEAAPSWSAFRNGTQFGHGELQILDARTAVWKWFRNVDGESVSRDEFEVTNSVSLPPTSAPTDIPTALGLFFPTLSTVGIAIIVTTGILLTVAMVAFARRWHSMYVARKDLLVVRGDEKQPQQHDSSLNAPLLA